MLGLVAGCNILWSLRINCAKPSRELFSSKEPCPIRRLDSVNYYLLKLSDFVETLQLFTPETKYECIASKLLVRMLTCNAVAYFLLHKKDATVSHTPST